MKESIVIRDVAVYHPEKVMSNDFYLKHFQEQGQDISRLLEALGRENRYLGDENETTLTMAIQASKKVLEKTNLAGEDIDMIVFASASPEYLYPPNAISIHHSIHGKLDTISYDLNAACVGMVVAVEQVIRTMMSNPYVKRALVVGSDQLQKYSRKDNPATFASFGDASAAVILEKQLTSVSGFIDSHLYTNSEPKDKIVFPSCGLSNMHRSDVSEYDKMVKWENVQEGNGADLASASIRKVLERNNVTPDDVKVYCLSQLSKKNVLRVKDSLSQPEHKFVMVGEEFGYTAASSPFVVLERAISNGNIQRGDYLMFWSVGAGITGCSVLFRF